MGWGHNLPPLSEMGLIDLTKLGWAIAHPAHQSPTSLCAMNKMRLHFSNDAHCVGVRSAGDLISSLLSTCHNLKDFCITIFQIMIPKSHSYFDLGVFWTCQFVNNFKFTPWLVNFRFFKKATKIWRNLPQNKEGDFVKFCGLLRMYELVNRCHFHRLSLTLPSK